LRGVHVLWSLIGFFAFVIAINVAFTVLAVRTFPGEDVRRSYLQGLHYNETLAARRAQAALGWRASAALAPSAAGAIVEVRIRERDGAPLSHLTVRGVLRRPTHESADVSLEFTPRGGGAYVAHIGRLDAGQWRLRARAERANGAALDLERSFFWPSTTP
jgi:nitrogen fixation protein FixH